jgi:hypothetical protein
MAKKSESIMHKKALGGHMKMHGSPMKKGGAHQAPVATRKVNPERRGTAKTGKKLSAM